MSDFQRKWWYLLKDIMANGNEVEVGEWQSQDVSHRPEMISRELMHSQLVFAIPATVEGLQAEVQPNLPWAEDHFLERVSGVALNPPPSEAWWPYAQKNNKEHKDGEQFSHTYPERIWPRFANIEGRSHEGRTIHVPHVGIRYLFGDLDDVVELLRKNPLTRQAYLPIWFPEDTGAVAGQRVPCTLGYHFLLRNGGADIVYHIRSCDLLRHFTDDVYMACRLLQWVVGMLQGHGIEVKPYRLIMNISSLHIFRGDYDRVNHMLRHHEDDEEPTYGAAV